MAIITAVAACGPAVADSPLPPPADHTVSSPRGTCIARTEVQPPRTSLRLASQPEAVLWSVPFWDPVLVVGDDCGVLGAGYDRGNLLVPDERVPDTPVMRFFRTGGVPARVVRLGDIYPDLSVLPRTASHWRWLEGSAWSGTAWTVRTVDGRTRSFAP